MKFGLSSHNVSGSDYVLFWVKGVIGGEVFYVGLKDTNSNEHKVPVTDYLSAITTYYQEVAIKTSHFTNVDMTTLDNFSITFRNDYGGPSTGTVYIDDLQFGRTGGWMTLNSFDASYHGKFSFWVKGDTTTLGVVLQEAGGTDSKVVEVSVTTESWTSHEIALSQFTGIDVSNLNAIHLALPPYGKTVYVDDIKLLGSGDTSNPSSPTNLKCNGEPVTDSFTFSISNVLSVNANSYSQDPTIEGVRFEYSPGGSKWYTIGTDYDVDDNTYAVGWGASNLVGQSGYKVRAVAQDVSGNKSGELCTSNHGFESAPVFVYPNPFYPYENTQRIHFLEIPADAILSIYTLSGELICTLEDDGDYADEHANDGKISWDGKNSNDAYVASGIYLYTVTKDRELVDRGKFVVIK